ncbi:MAG: halomucin, partial [Alloprevotella tannerae]|nr:halomucin [Alloprevotella tannerae]
SIQTGEDRLNFGQVAKGETKTIKLGVAYKNLSADVALSLSGEGAKVFTLSKDKFVVSEPNGNVEVDVAFAPQASGPQQAVLRLQSGETIAEVQLTGTGTRKAGDFTYSGGSGTQDDPYLISNSGDIEDLSLAVDTETDYAGKYFKLTNDIDMEAVKAMKPIGNNFGAEGTALKAFSGTFDGDNHTISNLTMRFSGRFYLGVGLFGIVKNAKISNLTLTNCYFEADAIVASVASVLVGSEIINCHAGENVIVKARLKPYAGGIATSSFLTPSSIVACTSRANVDASDVAIGGILGMSSASGTTISRCINYGNVNTLNNFAGGIVGFVESGRLNIVDCLNAGEISAASCVGGLLGMALQGASVDIRNAYNTGRVVATDPAGALGPIFPAAALTDGLTLDVQNCYYNEALFSGTSYGAGVALSEMRSQTFADKLNAGRSEIVWKRFVGVNNELPVPCGEGEVIDGLMQQALAASYVQIEAGQIKAAAGVRLLGVCDVAGRQYAPASKLAAGTYIVTFMPTQGAQKPMSVKLIVPLR